jgi:hypothetical protein
MEPKTFECKNGSKVKVYSDRDDVAQAAFEFYEQQSRLNMVCPYCGNDDQWDNLSYEFDGDQFEDTYTCDACDSLITIISPRDAGEYHNVYISDVTYMIEFMFGGAPSTWPVAESDDDKQPPLF